MKNWLESIFGLGLIALAGYLFYEIFFKLCPYIVSTIPQNEWHNFFKILTYTFVGYFGGIGIPLAIFIFGVYFFVDGI